MSYFIEVVNQQGISRAAEKLQITQQTLSSHIAALERELGCTLFYRKPKFRLTAEGELFLDYCRRFVRLDQTMHREFQDISGEVTGTIRVGISQTRSAILMPELISGFRKKYTKVRIHLSELTNDELLARIGNDALDLIIGDVSGERPDLLTEELYREQMALVIPRTSFFAPLRETLKTEKDPKVLVSWPMITNSLNDIVGRYISRVLLENRISPNIAAVSDSAETCLRMCAEGVGVYICPQLYINYFRALEDAYEVLPLPYSYAIHIAVRRTAHRAAAVDRFAEYCREQTAGLLQ
ncbi:MAG: LysR family transcriptional regulator [Stomatobaculum sp.]|nr:LysR family transcriptional regulator [Stomatobaculum sp.]